MGSSRSQPGVALASTAGSVNSAHTRSRGALKWWLPSRGMGQTGQEARVPYRPPGETVKAEPPRQATPSAQRDEARRPSPACHAHLVKHAGDLDGQPREPETPPRHRAQAHSAGPVLAWHLDAIARIRPPEG